MKKHMLPGAALAKGLSLAMVVLLMFAQSNSLRAQCAFINNNWGSVTPGCGAFGANFSLPSTSYATFTAVAGVNYDIATCDGSWDSQITGYDGSNNYAGFYNDDNGPSCASLLASANWTSTFDGTVKVLVERYNCGNAANWPGTSALLKVSQNAFVTQTTSTAAICGNGSTRSLTSSYSGTYTGAPTVTYSVVSGPGSVSGSTYTASGVSGASQTVTIRA